MNYTLTQKRLESTINFSAAILQILEILNYKRDANKNVKALGTLHYGL